MAIALSRKWLCLHGAAAGASLTPRDAARRQISVDTDATSLHGIRAALRRAAPAQALAIALELSEPRILRIAGEEVARRPQLLNEVDFSSASAQQVWAHALRLNTEAWRGPADPQRSFTAVLQNLLDGGPARAELIAGLAMSPVGDLAGFSRRDEVWSRLGNPARANLLTATAAGWLERAAAGHIDYGPDAQLEAAIQSSDRLGSALRALAATGPGSAFAIIAALGTFEESRFVEWLGDWSAVRQPMARGDADALGRLVLDRNWQRALDHLVGLTRNGRNDLKPALRVCINMIGIFTRWTLGLSPVSSDDKWTVLEDLAAHLYPNGPDHNDLWDRAGGRDADLQSVGTGRVRWHDAIGQMRRGKGPRSARLLEEMRRDYPLNDRVRYLENDPDLGAGHK